VILNQFTLVGSREDCIRKAMFCVDDCKVMQWGNITDTLEKNLI